MDDSTHHATPTDAAPSQEELVAKLADAKSRIDAEIRKVVLGQDEVIEQVLTAVLAGGHCLLTGAPGLAKTLLIQTLSRVFDVSFQRIQFTPDLMPSDLVGTEILEDTDSGRKLVYRPGPVFANMVLADEINRTPPKTQSALLEAMQEKQVTAAGETRPLPRPFYVFATQNPIEMEGTYPLPEAQLDRFMFSILVDYLDEDAETAVVAKTTSSGEEEVNAVFNAEDLVAFQGLVRDVPVAEAIVRYAVRLCAATRPGRSQFPDIIGEHISWGAGLRAPQNLVLAGKTRALLQGRAHVTVEDIQAAALPVLRHRVLTNYRAEADGVTVEDIIGRLIQTVPGV